MNQPPPEPPRQVAVAFEVTSLARRRRRIDPGWIAIGLVVALVVAAILHPWQGSNGSIAVVPGPSAAPTTLTTTANPSVAPAAPEETTADDLAVAIDQLGADAAPWGIGVGAAVGPSLQPTLEIPALGVATDQAWWAWIVTRPAPAGSPAGGATDAIVRLPVSKLCSGVPDLPTGGRILEVTTPEGALPPVQLQAWHEVGWHDEPRDIEALPMNDLIPGSSGRLSYLQLADGAAWPDGRYELTLPGSSATSLTVCLGQP